MLKICYVT